MGDAVTDWPGITEDLLIRQFGMCPVCAEPLGGEVARHHRKLRSQGGRHDLVNLLLLHGDCHREVHDGPAHARTHGWIVPSWADPDDVAVDSCGQDCDENRW